MKTYAVKFPSARARFDSLDSLAKLIADNKNHGIGETFDAIAQAPALDLDALRLVLDAAKWAQETKDDGRQDDDERETWSKTQDAIEKLEALTK